MAPGKSLESQLRPRSGDGPIRNPPRRLPSAENSTDDDSSQEGQQRQRACNACGFEEEFIDEGMYPCEKCHQVYYCSLECLKWDWKGGDHRNTCVGLEESDDSGGNEGSEGSEQSFHSSDESEAESANSSDSIDAFEEGSDSRSGGKRDRSVSPVEEKSEQPPPLKKPSDRFPSTSEREFDDSLPALTPAPLSPEPVATSNSRFTQMKNKLAAREANAAAPPPEAPRTAAAVPNKTRGSVQDRMKLFEKEDEPPQKMEWRSINGKMTLVPANAPKEQPPSKYRPTTPTADPNMVPSVNMETKKQMDLEEKEKALAQAGLLYKTHHEHAENLSHLNELEEKVQVASSPSPAANAASARKLRQIKDNLLDQTHLQQLKQEKTPSPTLSVIERKKLASQQLGIGRAEITGEDGVRNSDMDESMSTSEVAGSDQPLASSSVASSSNFGANKDSSNSDSLRARGGKDQLNVSLWLNEQDSIVSNLDDDEAWEIGGNDQAEGTQPGAQQQQQQQFENNNSTSKHNSKSMLGGARFDSDSDEDEDVLFAPPPMAEADASAGGAARTLSSKQQQANAAPSAPKQQRGLFSRMGDFFTGGDTSASDLGHATEPSQDKGASLQNQPLEQQSSSPAGLDSAPTQGSLSKPDQPQSGQSRRNQRPGPQESDGIRIARQGGDRGRGRKGGLLPTNDLLGPSTFDQRPPSNGRPDNPFKKSLDRSYQRSLRHRQTKRSQSPAADVKMAQVHEGLQCNACAMDAEFVSEGLTPCHYCEDAFYCTEDCLDWDWKHGGHSEECSGDVNNVRDSLKKGDRDMVEDDGLDAMSIDPFDTGPEEGLQRITGRNVDATENSSPSSNAEQLPNGETQAAACASCNIDSEFVSDGMKSCPYCSKVYYCSAECLQWHWDSGGHQRSCDGDLTSVKKSADSPIEIATVDSDSDTSINAFDATKTEAMQQPKGILGRLRAAKLRSHSNENSPSSVTGSARTCKACKIEAEFVPDGLIVCAQCKQTQYCSKDCQQWHWSHGHSKACTGKFKNGAIQAPVDDNHEVSNAFSDDASIQAFDESAAQCNTPGSQDSIMEALRASQKQNASRSLPLTPTAANNQQKCKACGMDKEYVPDGMKKCGRCFKVSYCSTECLEWDWASGGHLQVCTGVSEAERIVGRQKAPSNLDASGEDDASIAAFDSNINDQPEMPRTHGDIMEVLRKSEKQSSSQDEEQLPVIDPSRCTACGMNETYVPEGMLKCSRCSIVPYCSDDCRQWDWTSGGHVNTCSALTKAERINALSSSTIGASIPGDDDSIDAFETPEKEPINCAACNTSPDFVPDGMIECPKCGSVSYCSTDCMTWHWKQGGHYKVCQGNTCREPDIAVVDDDSEVMSIDPFDSEDHSPLSQAGAMAAIEQSQDQARGGKKSLKCQACNIDSEFVSDEMLSCERCQNVSYCSTDCMQWHWRSGGHSKACEGNKNAKTALSEEKEVPHDSDLESIDPFGGGDDGIPLSQEEVHSAPTKSAVGQTDVSKPVAPSTKSLKCKACGMDSEFVPEGMKNCAKCSNVAYCSKDCMEWDWKSGGHKNVCEGLSEAERCMTLLVPTAADDDMSIDAFEGESKSPSEKTAACAACGIDSDFVSEGMLDCVCHKAAYCSPDCQQWHWRIHKKDCSRVDAAKALATTAVAVCAADTPANLADDESIAPFDDEDQSQAVAPRSSAEVANATRAESVDQTKDADHPALSVKCHTCAMEEEFVPEGMIKCPKCEHVIYCSDECRNWDWESGGHKDSCGSKVREAAASQSAAKVPAATPLSVSTSASNTNSDSDSDDSVISSQEEATIAATIVKAKGEKVGLLLGEKDNKLYVSRIVPGGLTSQTPLKVGMQVVSINGVDCTNLPVANAANVLVEAEGDITILAMQPEFAPGVIMVDDESDSAYSGSDSGSSSGSDSQSNSEADSMDSSHESQNAAIATPKAEQKINAGEIGEIDADQAETATSRFTFYRQYLAATLITTVSGYISGSDNDEKISRAAAGSSSDDSSSSGSSSSSSSSGNTGLGSVHSSSDDSMPPIKLKSKVNSYLKKNYVGATQLATADDDGDLPTYFDKEDESSPPSLMKMPKPGSSALLTPLAPPSDSSDIESGLSLAKVSAASAVPEEVIESRKRFRNQCVISHILLVIAAIAIAIGLSVRYLGNTDDDSASSDLGTPVPTIPSLDTVAPSTVLLPPSSPSVAPVSAPSFPPVETATPTVSDQAGNLLTLIIANSFDDGTAVVTDGSPQYRAFEWLLADPGLPSYPEDRILQRYALATFYFSTSGDTWQENSLWLSNENECNWFSRTASFPVCKSDQYVTLELDFNNLDGTMPNELALLNKLERVELSGGPNSFLAGSLPSELGLLTGLDYLSLRENGLRGTLPVEIGNWQLIRTLNLSLNRFRGTIPSTVGSLTRLSEIFLGSNELSGALPSEIGEATNLFRISLGGNKLRGDLPSQIGQLSELRYIYLESNAISSVPSEVGLLSNLLVIAMFENALAGPLPTEIGQLSLLRSLLMASNTLTSTIPSELGWLGSQLGKHGNVCLDLAWLRFFFVAPSCSDKTDNYFLFSFLLGNLDLSFNKIAGSIPSELGLLTSLRKFRTGAIMLNCHHFIF